MADTAQWPPKSPHEALLSTPGGRRRIQNLMDRTSPSQSRPRQSRPNTPRSTRTAITPEPNAVEDQDEDEDDEETLQLKLQAIQAKLKLKKLQNAKAQNKSTAASPVKEPYLRPKSAPSVAPSGVPLQARLLATRDQSERPRSQAAVQVPASPVKRSASAAALPPSPARVTLGIDKGRAANEVSLKRASSAKAGREQDGRSQGGYLQRNRAPLAVLEQRPERPKSFSERLQGARTEEGVRLEKQQRVQVARSSGFSISHKEMEYMKSQAVEIPSGPQTARHFSRDEIMASTYRTKQKAGSTISDATEAERSQPSFEAYTSFHLAKRYIPHQTLTRAINGKAHYMLADLLKHVKYPDWSLPEVEQDIVVFAIIASKSDPRSHKPKPGTDANADRGKYMVMTIVDLQWEIELYLFNGGFDRFWKLVPGTLVAILNPTIMPPPANRAATGRFGLVINSDADTILEIGSARDLGFCQSVKADGKMCSAWVNARRTQYCEFHTNEAVRRAQGGRIEMNDIGFGMRKSGAGKSHRWNSYDVEDLELKAARKQAAKQSGTDKYDRGTGSHLYVNGANSGIGLLDDERENGRADAAERRLALKRRLAMREKEKDIAKKLAQTGAGAGRDYMQSRPSYLTSSTSSASSAAGYIGDSLSADNLQPKKVDAKSLGLLASRGHEISLQPVKRKRPVSALSTSISTAGNSSLDRKAGSALGWGTSLKGKLERMKDGEHLEGGPSSRAEQPTRERSPVRKKTRFITEKGIREAGRDSLAAPADMPPSVGLDDDDDDELLIVK